MSLEGTRAAEEPDTSSRRTYRWIDFAAGVFFVALGLFVLSQMDELDILATNRPGPGLLPLILSAVFVVAGAALAVKQLVRPNTKPYPATSRGGGARVAAVFALLVGTVVLFEPLGFILSSVLLMGGLTFGIERKFTITAVCVVLLVPVLLWVLFAILLGVRLPPGLIFF